MQTVGRDEIDRAHEELGTGEHVPGLDLNGQDPHGSDEERQLSFDVGGKKPLQAKFSLTGALEVPGAYLKGELVTLEIQCVVSEVAFADEHDRETDQVVNCLRKHKARVLETRVV